MATQNDQIVSDWDEWLAQMGQSSGDPAEFVDWAIANGRLHSLAQDVKKMQRRRVTTALQQVRRVDGDGIEYRGKQSVIDFEDGHPVSHWFDTDTGGSPRLRAKAIKQRRDAIANDVYRAKCDRDHMNKRHGENHQFILDFTDDCMEKEAADRAEREDDAA